MESPVSSIPGFSILRLRVSGVCRAIAANFSVPGPSVVTGELRVEIAGALVEAGDGGPALLIAREAAVGRAAAAIVRAPAAVLSLSGGGCRDGEGSNGEGGEDRTHGCSPCCCIVCLVVSRGSPVQPHATAE